MSELIREWIAIKLLELAMLIAPKEMELAIAKGISLTFPVMSDPTNPAAEVKEE